MQNVSDRFIAAMGTHPYIARLTLDGVDTIQGDAIKGISFTDGSFSDNASVIVGYLAASCIEIDLDMSLITVPLKGRSVTIELGIAIDGYPEWLLMGTYKITDASESDGVITVVCKDAAAHAFDATYEDTVDFDFTAEGGVSSTAFLQHLCDRRGVTVDLADLEDIPLQYISPSGRTERAIIAMIAGLYGKFAYADRTGVLRFRMYNVADAEVFADDYYEDSMKRSSTTVTVGWIKCYVESLEETLVEGDAAAEHGIYFECPWMTEERLALLWERYGGFTYRPVAELEFLGDPRLDVGDIITLNDLNGTESLVPVMGIRHEFDGGLRTQAASQCQTQGDVHEGPIQREVKRTTAKIIKKQNEIQATVKALETKVDQNAEKTSTQITQSVQNAQSIIFSALEEYARTSDVDALRETISAQLSILASEVNISVSQSREEMTTQNEALQAQINEITANYRFTADGQYIGKTDSDTMLRLINDMMQILVAGVAETTVDRTGLTAEQANIKTLHMGDYTLALGNDGHLTLT